MYAWEVNRFPTHSGFYWLNIHFVATLPALYNLSKLDWSCIFVSLPRIDRCVREISLTSTTSDFEQLALAEEESGEAVI